MGGLVVANALCRDQKKTIADHAIGTLFLGTPFLGSSKAKYAVIATAILDYIIPTQRFNVKDLRVRSKKLADICEAFAKFLKARDRSQDLPYLEVACFFEERPMSKRAGFVVPRESATWLGVDALSIPANHVKMAKFEDGHGSDYKMVVGKLKEWINNIDKNKAGGVGGLNAQVCCPDSRVEIIGLAFSLNLANHQHLMTVHYHTPGRDQVRELSEFWRCPGGKSCRHHQGREPYNWRERRDRCTSSHLYVCL